MKHFLVVIILFSLGLFVLPQTAHAACDDYPSFCDTHPRPASNPKDPNPNSRCVINGVTNNPLTNESWNYHYATSTQCGLFGWDKGPCVPRCGFLNSGFCCSPDNKPAPAPSTQSIAPPCNFTNGICTSVNTPFGAIQTDIAGLTKNIFSVLLGLSGGVAILLIIAAGYQMMTSQGNPEKVKEARERLTAAIVGLLFIIFSVTILQIIGVDILQIPGFGR